MAQSHVSTLDVTAKVTSMPVLQLGDRQRFGGHHAVAGQEAHSTVAKVMCLLSFCLTTAACIQ